MEIMTIIGARPQFIKAATVSRVIQDESDCRETLVHTGQHYDANMSDVFFEELQIPRPDHHLGIGSGNHGAQTGRMLTEIEKLLLEKRPDWLLVYGDTNSTIAGALAAAKLHVPVAHVEAGLRSFNRRMPEEINRVMTDHASERLFVPTETARENLLREGLSPERIVFTGDVMYDAHLFYRQLAAEKSDVLTQHGLQESEFVLATVHRAENTDDVVRLDRIVAGLNELSEEVTVVWPIHPRTRNVLERLADQVTQPNKRLMLIDPVGYLDMIRLEVSAKLITTDSGGVQKEAFFAGVPCTTLRDETEWVELVEMGWNELIAPGSVADIGGRLKAALSHINRPRLSGSPYGEGTAAESIVQSLQSAATEDATVD